MRKLLVILCLSFATGAPAQCVLKGRVYNREKKENMAFATVRVLGSFNRIYSAFTDADGRYRIDSIPAGTHDVLFSDGDMKYKDTVVAWVLFSPGAITELSVNFPTFCEYRHASKICPICRKRDKVIPIVYGYPSGMTVKKAKRGAALLGGCMVTRCDPMHYCKRDKKKF